MQHAHEALIRPLCAVSLLQPSALQPAAFYMIKIWVYNICPAISTFKSHIGLWLTVQPQDGKCLTSYYASEQPLNISSQMQSKCAWICCISETNGATISKHTFSSPNCHEIYVSLQGYKVSRLYGSLSLRELHVSRSFLMHCSNTCTFVQSKWILPLS